VTIVSLDTLGDETQIGLVLFLSHYEVRQGKGRH